MIAIGAPTRRDPNRGAGRARVERVGAHVVQRLCKVAEVPEDDATATIDGQPHAARLGLRPKLVGHELNDIRDGDVFARALRSSSPDAAFSFLSGNGADPTGHSRLPYARYKGEAEKTLLAEGFPHVYIFRPAYIYPVEPRKEPNFSYRLLRGIYPAFRVLFPNQVIRADDLGRIMVDAAVQGTPQRNGPVFENRDIRAMVASGATASGP